MSINSIYAGSTPNSRETIRQQYLNNLTLDIANQTKNLNANKLFKANGTTGSAPPDTRSATEKYEDLDALKVQVRAGLKQITDGMEAENIVADITTPELQFLAMRMPQIIIDLKPKFALGVPAGSFLPYLRRLMRVNIETEGIEYGLQANAPTAGGIAGGVNLNIFDDLDFGSNLQVNSEVGNQLADLTGSAKGRENQQIKELLERFRELKTIAPTPDDRSIVASLGDPDILDEYDARVAVMSQYIPSEAIIERALSQHPVSAVIKEMKGLLDGITWEELRETKREIQRIRSQYLPRIENPNSLSNIEAREQERATAPEQQFLDYSLDPLGIGETLMHKQIPQSGYASGQVFAEQEESDLPSAYVNEPSNTIKQTISENQPSVQRFMPLKEFLRLPSQQKEDLLLQYADAGLFSDMDAGFLHVINSIHELEPPFVVPVKDIDLAYKKFLRTSLEGNLQMNQLPSNPNAFEDPVPESESEIFVRTGARPIARPLNQPQIRNLGESEKMKMGSQPPITQPPITQPRRTYSESEKMNRGMIMEKLENGDFDEYPDYKEVATDIVMTDKVSQEMIDNFINIFDRQVEAQKGSESPLAGEDISLSGFEPEETYGVPYVVPEPAKSKSKKPPVELVIEEDEPTTILPPSSASKSKSTASASAKPKPNLAELEAFSKISIPQKIAVLESMRDDGTIPTIKLINRVNALRKNPQDKTLDTLYDDILMETGHYDVPTMSVEKTKEGSTAEGSTTVETPEKGSARSINAPTEELFGSAEKAVAPPLYPKNMSAFKKVATGNEAKRAIIEKAYHEQILDTDAIYNDEGDVIAEISDATINLFKRLFPPNYRGGDFIPEKTTGAVLEEAYKGIIDVLKAKKLLGTGLGLGMPVPHHVLGTNGYGIKPNQGRPMMQTMGGSLHHTKSAPMGEWGSGLPKNKKKGNIIFGMGLASVVPQPKVKVESKNINLSAGIEAEPAYVRFGTHLLNKHRLKDNVVMMRTMKGGAIVNIPTQRISGKLARVLHTISGGGIPQFESVMDLADDDKALLHRIAKTSKVSNRLSVPNPNKSKMEEEDNRFNILRGEVSIGNDAPAVIKEFKVLLLKFMREGRVPSGQGKAIMEELLLLGY